MKKTMFLILFCAGTIMMYAQQHRYYRNRPPDMVIRSYQKEYRNYDHNPTWDMQNNQWHTRYMDKQNGNRNVDVYYDKSGRHVQTGREWDPIKLPPMVRDQLSK